MSDKPIPFKAPMVRAILREIEKPGSGKTQTRRVLKPQPDDLYEGQIPEALRISAGDRVWVREPWRTLHKFDSLAPRNLPDDRSKITYEADPEHRNPLWAFGKLRPSMFMPRWASRLTLTVTAVKVERLQDISEADAIAEGVEPNFNRTAWRCYLPEPKLQDHWASPCESFRTLWTSINGPDAWAANPWVAAYTFTPALGNIDQAKRSAA